MDEKNDFFAFRCKVLKEFKDRKGVSEATNEKEGCHEWTQMDTNDVFSRARKINTPTATPRNL